MSILMVLRDRVQGAGAQQDAHRLTMLGMIIGVAAVITMVALGTGAQSSIEDADQGAPAPT